MVELPEWSRRLLRALGPLAREELRKKIPKLQRKLKKLAKRLVIPVLAIAILLAVYPPARDVLHVAGETAGRALYRISELLGIPLQSNLPENFDYSAVPAYSGEPWISVNGGTPFFTVEEKKTRDVSIAPGKQDLLGRCTAAVACLDRGCLPAGELERERLKTVPTGWRQNSYACVDDGDWETGDLGYLYNRSHLLAFCLTGLQDEPKNLITGTRYMNVDGMLPIESKVLNYLYGHPKNHVLYRVTPVFSGANMLSNGVLMEAWSVEDGGRLQICVFAYNVQPGIGIDYVTGDNWYSGVFLDTVSSSVVCPAA